ncbi:hypothetical protein [Lewinella cohaerens]|uniref:hypothetical protein n=1 Tax=Lewinella cohaerens TaxID=70995 RepID=UPI000360CFA1|nr:hypothetical protein [Lewinella cohaerens]
MAKRKKNPERSMEVGLDHEDKRALWRTVMVSSIVLGVILTVIYILIGKLFPNNANWLNATRTGVSLLAFWLVITSTIRTFDKVREGVAFFWHLIIGVASAAIGILLFLLALRVWNELGHHGATLPGYNIIGFYAAGGLVASSISMIHLRVEGENNGNLLELLVIAIAVAIFFWVT